MAAVPVVSTHLQAPPQFASATMPAAMDRRDDLLTLISEDFTMAEFDMLDDSQREGEPSARPKRAVKREPGAFEELQDFEEEEEEGEKTQRTLREYDEALAAQKQEYMVASRRGYFGEEGPKHGSKVCLRFLEYQCGYCGERKISTSAGGDGRVRIRCDCGGKHSDGEPRMHAKWKMCTDTPLVEDPEEMPMAALVGGRPFSSSKRGSLAAAAPY